MRDPEVLRAVCYEDKRPPRPSEPEIQRGLNDAMWNLMQACWETEPRERPDMIQVVAHFTSNSSVQILTTKRDIFDPLSKRKIHSPEDGESSSSSRGILEFTNMYRHFDRVPLLDIHMQWLSQVCKDGRVNAANLCELLKSTKPADINRKNIKVSLDVELMIIYYLG